MRQAFFRLVALTVLGVVLSSDFALGNQRCNACHFAGRDCRLVGAFGEGIGSPADCETERKSSICQSELCGGTQTQKSPHSIKPTTCQGSAECLHEAGDAQQRGARDLIEINKQEREEARQHREVQAISLDRANAILDRWNNALNNGDNRGTTRSQWNNDRALVKKAVRSFEGKGQFSREEVMQAREGSIKRELGTFAANQGFEQLFHEAIKKNEHAIQMLGEMNKHTNERKSDLVSIANTDGGAAQLAESIEGGGPMAVALADHASRGERQSKLSERNPSSRNGPEEKTKEREKIRFDEAKRSLRDQLRARLARGAEESQDSMLEQNIDDPLSKSAHDSDETPDKLKALSEILNGATERFTLEGADTDRAVKEMVDQAEGLLSGVLERESLDLFSRVRNAHRTCEQRECVVQLRK